MSSVVVLRTEPGDLNELLDSVFGKRYSPGP
jgi:hypothetical protein